MKKLLILSILLTGCVEGTLTKEQAKYDSIVKHDALKDELDSLKQALGKDTCRINAQIDSVNAKSL